MAPDAVATKKQKGDLVDARWKPVDSTADLAEFNIALNGNNDALGAILQEHGTPLARFIGARFRSLVGKAVDPDDRLILSPINHPSPP